MKPTLTAAFGLENQARSIVPCYAAPAPGLHHFYAVTSIPSVHGGSRQKNRISLLSYDSDAGVLDRNVVWNVDDEVWHASTSPNATTQSLLALVNPKQEARIVKAPNLSGGNSASSTGDSLETLGVVSASFVVWDPEGVQRDIRGPNNARGELCYYSLEHLDQQQPTLTVTLVTPDATGASVVATSAAADPHHPAVTAVSYVRNPKDNVNASSSSSVPTTGVVLIDERAKKRQFNFPSVVSHGGRVEHVSFSVAQPYRMSTCGVDGRVSIWDLRQAASGPTAATTAATKAGTPSWSISKKLSLQAHHHRAYGALFHSCHDSLLLTWGADAALKLWQCGSVTAAPLSGTVELQSTVRSPLEERPKLASCVTDFGDTVYGATWSAQGSWVYAGVSFNGKVLVGSVDSDTKQKLRLGTE